ncbi:DUF6160 family protein [Acinetobacter sp. GXMZU3951]
MSTNKIIKLSVLASSVLLAQQVFALQELSDQNLRTVSGQDGITLTYETDRVTIDQFNWKDNTNFSNGTLGNLNLSLNNIEVTKVDNHKIGGKVKLDVGTNANKTGIRLEAVVNPANIHMAKVAVCGDAARGADCASQNTLGALTLQNRAPMNFVLETRSGLFNSKDKAYLEFGLQNANIFHTLKNGSEYNQFILKDFNFNFKGTGYLYLDADKGMVLSTTSPNATDSSVNEVVLERVPDLDNPGKTRPGFNLDVRYKTNVGNDAKNYTANDNTDQLNSIIRIGASGRLRDAEISVNADRTNLGGAEGTSISSNPMTGSTGLHVNVKTSFTRDEKNASGAIVAEGTRFELGHTGKNSYVIEFGNLTPLQIRTQSGSSLVANNSLAYINFGDIYINAVQTKSLEFEIGQNIAKLLGKQAGIDRYSLSNTAQNAVAIAVRGMDFQAIARNAKFIANNSNDASHQISSQSATWGLGIPIYNLNANLGLYGTTYGANNAEAIGFGLTMSTQGRDASGSKTTSIILIDGAPNSYNTTEEVNYYTGLRNIDLFMDAQGVLALQQSGIKLDLPRLVIAMGAEIALGQLPGSRYETSACANAATSNLSCFVPANSFTNTDDVLFGLALRLDSSAQLNILPGTAADNHLAIQGNIKLNASDAINNRNYLHFSNVQDNATIGFDRIQGELDLNAKIVLEKDQVKFNNSIRLNPSNQAAGVLKADVNLYPTVDRAQNLGTMVMTGGNIRSSFGITPR